ncbi:MAG: ATP-binding protein [Methylococcaceae bacterium]|nr:MAG: ATP-binding protein [Methylococcaceae bacterium]
MRFFNTAGPSVDGQHYMIPPLQRLDLPEVEALIEQQRYFVLHAPRQTGKTSCLLALMRHLNAQGRYQALYANIEAAQAARGDVARGVETIIDFIAMEGALYLHDERFNAWKQDALSAGAALTAYLSRWAQAADKPVVLMLDEVDALVGDTLISLLRQVRAGYHRRPAAFPQAIILCGVRDVRDYRIHTKDQEIITGGSAFNIKAVSLRLGNFSRAEAAALFQQHTEDTGQAFMPEIFAELWEDTQGQPWLVNALGHELTWQDKAARERSVPITLERYQAARERLIRSRATHLDQLTDKLKEKRVHRVMAPLLQSEGSSREFREDDLQYVEDLGLIRRKPEVTIANRIYRETIPRELTAPIQDGLHQQTAWYVTPDHRLDLLKLLAAFQQFFREHADAWLERFDYKEAGPQLLLQAFLQRVVNGGGRVNREYGLGLRRTDLLLEWPLDEWQGYHGPVQRVVIELKLLHKSLQQTLAAGLEQTADYADRCGASEAHLLIFDRRSGIPWEEKIRHSAESYDGRIIQVWGA